MVEGNEWRMVQERENEMPTPDKDYASERNNT